MGLSHIWTGVHYGKYVQEGFWDICPCLCKLRVKTWYWDSVRQHIPIIGLGNTTEMEEPFTLLEVHADYFYIKLEKLPPYAQIFYGGALQAHFCVFLQKKIAEWKKIAGGKKILAKKILVKKKKIQLRLNLAMSKSFFFCRASRDLTNRFGVSRAVERT